MTIDGFTDSTKPDNIALKLFTDGRVRVVNGGSASIKVDGSTVIGSSGNDTLHGGSANIFLVGIAKNDQLFSAKTATTASSTATA